jgi:hypothetical protein
MHELLHILAPVVDDWRHRTVPELEARLRPLTDVGGITEATFIRVVHHLLRHPELRMRLDGSGGGGSLPGYDARCRFTASLDQFYAMGDGTRVRRSVAADGKTQTGLLVKVTEVGFHSHYMARTNSVFSQDTVDTIITPVGRYPEAPGHFPSKGLKVRFSANREQPVTTSQMPATVESTMVMIQLLLPVSFSL